MRTKSKSGLKSSSKRQRQRSEWRWEVTVTYKGLDYDFDKEASKLAKRFRGDKGGSGFFFPTGDRDHSFLFMRKNSAEAFMVRVKKIQIVVHQDGGRTRKITPKAELYPWPPA